MNCAVRDSYFMRKQLTIKEVEICLVSPSVSYSFGKTGAPNKEMELIVPTDKTSYASQNNRVIRLQEFTVKNGNTTYQVSAGTNDEGHNFATLDVYQGTETKPVSIWQR